MGKKRLGTLEVSASGLGCMGMIGSYRHADREQFSHDPILQNIPV